MRLRKRDIFTANQVGVVSLHFFMKIITTVQAMRAAVDALNSQGKVLGFVPTMGALHEGHLSLIDACGRQSDVTVASVFVNPLQFNNRGDFEQYPQFPEKDARMLDSRGCDFLFHPSEEEMYPEAVQTDYDFGSLASVMEGAFRPGHFNGVGVVVKRLFDIVQPDLAFFGEKDYQQLLIIRRLVEIHRMNIRIVGCPIIREPDGLAMSSRNLRLTAEQRALAPEIYRILQEAVALTTMLEPEALKARVMEQLSAVPGLRPEYFEIADENSLAPISSWKAGQALIACVAVWMGEIRLIDNIRFIRNFAA